jgi:hypothetical protein
MVYEGDGGKGGGCVVVVIQICIVRKGEEEKGTPVRAGALFSTGDP